MQRTSLASPLALASTGNNSPQRIATTVTTANSSIKLNPRRVLSLIEVMIIVPVARGE
jgi:hypothetical protein